MVKEITPFLSNVEAKVKDPVRTTPSFVIHPNGYTTITFKNGRSVTGIVDEETGKLLMFTTDSDYSTLVDANEFVKMCHKEMLMPPLGVY